MNGRQSADNSSSSLLPPLLDEGSQPAGDDLYDITNDCALFDFALYTIGVGLMVALGVAGNGLSFVVLTSSGDAVGGGSRSGGGRSGPSTGGGGAATTSFLLRALAAADTTVLLAAVPLYVLPPIYPMTGYLGSYYRTYVAVMPFLWPVYLVPFTVSVFITVLVSIDRYLAVCRPFGVCTAGGGGGRSGLCGVGARLCCPRSPLTVGRVRPLVAALVVGAVIYNVPRFFEYRAVEECVGVNRTRVGFEIGEFGEHLFYRIVYANVLYFIVVHGGPLVALAFLNFRLVQALRMRSRRRLALKSPVSPNCANGGISMTSSSVTGTGNAGAAAATGGGGSSRHQRDVTLTLVGVICVFIVCQTPTLVDHVLWTAVDKEMRQCGGWHYFYTAVGDAMAVLNSSVNFGVYVLTSRRFRRGVVDALRCVGDGRRPCCCCCCGRGIVARSGTARRRRRRLDFGETTCATVDDEATAINLVASASPNDDGHRGRLRRFRLLSSMSLSASLSSSDGGGVRAGRGSAGGVIWRRRRERWRAIIDRANALTLSLKAESTDAAFDPRPFSPPATTSREEDPPPAPPARTRTTSDRRWRPTRMNALNEDDGETGDGGDADGDACGTDRASEGGCGETIPHALAMSTCAAAADAF